MSLHTSVNQILDPAVRETFYRLQRSLEEQAILQGHWKFYEVEIDATVTKLPFKHNLPFVPQDVILLSIIGNYNMYFNYVDFDSSNIYITTSGACRIRFLTGRYIKRD